MIGENYARCTQFLCSQRIFRAVYSLDDERLIAPRFFYPRQITPSNSRGGKLLPNTGVGHGLAVFVDDIAKGT